MALSTIDNTTLPKGTRPAQLVAALTDLLAVYDKHLGGLGLPAARNARLLLQTIRLEKATRSRKRKGK